MSPRASRAWPCVCPDVCLQSCWWGPAHIPPCLLWQQQRPAPQHPATTCPTAPGALPTCGALVPFLSPCTTALLRPRPPVRTQCCLGHPAVVGLGAHSWGFRTCSALPVERPPLHLPARPLGERSGQEQEPRDPEALRGSLPGPWVLSVTRSAVRSISPLPAGGSFPGAPFCSLGSSLRPGSLLHPWCPARCPVPPPPTPLLRASAGVDSARSPDHSLGPPGALPWPALASAGTLPFSARVDPPLGPSPPVGRCPTLLVALTPSVVVTRRPASAVGVSALWFEGRCRFLKISDLGAQSQLVPGKRGNSSPFTARKGPPGLCPRTTRVFQEATV